MRINVNGITREMTAEEEAKYTQNTEFSVKATIADLKQQLCDTDYKAIKYAEGWLTEEEYAPIKEERQTLRNRINDLEEEIEC